MSCKRTVRLLAGDERYIQVSHMSSTARPLRRESATAGEGVIDLHMMGSAR